MNPLRWPLARQLPIIVCAVVGGLVAVAFGYMADQAGAGASGGYSSIASWFRFEFWRGGYPWALAGALSGAALAYTLKLNNR